MRGGFAMFGMVGGIVMLTTFLLVPEPHAPEVVESFPLSSQFEMPDFAAIDHPAERKAEFLAFLRPYVDQINREITAQRQILENARERLAAGRTLTTTEVVALSVLAQRYKVKLVEPPSVAFVDELLRRVDILPPSLVLAQAASESAWGTSRFARRGNAIFGQWCYSEDCGLVPARRSDGEVHEVRRFKTVMDSVRAYFRNINTHWAYASLREMRAQLRADEATLRGTELAAGLIRYSERRQAYVDDIRDIIRVNQLGVLDQSLLALEGSL